MQKEGWSRRARGERERRGAGTSVETGARMEEGRKKPEKRGSALFFLLSTLVTGME